MQNKMNPFIFYAEVPPVFASSANKMNPFIFYAEVPPVFASSAKIDNLSQKKIINSHVLFNLAKEYTHSRNI